LHSRAPGAKAPARSAVSLRSIVGAASLLGLAAAADAETSRFVPWTRAEVPTLALKDLSGRAHTLADYRGKVVLVNFWATWCEPCREELPSMRALRERLAGRPFEVLAVNYGESASRVREFLERERLDFVTLLDPNQDAARAWRVRVLPGSLASDEALRTVRTLLPAAPATTTPGGRGGR